MDRDDTGRRPWVGACNGLVVIATALVALYIGLNRPSYNWDIIGYLASAQDVGGISDAQLSRRTYGELRARVPARKFAELVHGVAGTDSVYRRTVFRDPGSLVQQIPFYAIKWLYVVSIRGLAALGMNAVRASYVISAVCSALGVGLIYLLMCRWRLPALALPFVTAYCGLATVGTLSSPDAMAALASLAAFHLAAARPRWAPVLIAVLPLIRPELILLSALLFGFLAFHHGLVRASAWGLALSVALYLLIGHVEHAYSYLQLFNFSFIDRVPYPDGMPLSTHGRDYVMPYITMGTYILYHPALACFGIAAVMLWWRGRGSGGPDERLFLAIPVAYTGLHMLLFPEFRLRFFSAEAAIVFGYLLSRLDAFGAPRPAPAGG